MEEVMTGSAIRAPIAERWLIALVAVAYALLVLSMSGIFAFTSGMPYETGFPYMSESSSPLWRGFFYWNDSLRINTNTFYHLSYLLAEIFGVPGSFAPYQIVYAILWWARGFLVFLILRRLLPGCLLLCYAIGALVIVHASDGALLWVGQLNQFGYIFWMLLAFYVFIAAIRSATSSRTAFYILLAGVFEYMSLWSYEGQLFIILALPLLFLIFDNTASPRRRIVFAAWYLVPVVYVFLSVSRYFHSAARTYQASVVRTNFSARALISDLFFNVWASLSVWSWNRIASDIPRWHVILLAILAALTFISAGAVLLLRSSPEQPDRFRSIPRVTVASKVLLAGSLLLFLSFPVYLLLDSARSLWRTQILSGVGAAMVMGSAIGLLAVLIRHERLRRIFFLGLTAAIVFFGSYCAIQRGGSHRTRWLIHKHAMAEVVRAAPEVKPGTIFVLVNIPKKNDPFWISQWFDMALRLAYPGTPVAGTYFYDDHTPGRGANLILESAGWHWNHTFLEPLVDTAGLAQTIVIEYGANGFGKVLPVLPPYLCHGVCSAQLYHPEDRMAGSQPAPRASRRYGPF